jgi:hypothetical protein
MAAISLLTSRPFLFSLKRLHLNHSSDIHEGTSVLLAMFDASRVVATIVARYCVHILLGRNAGGGGNRHCGAVEKPTVMILRRSY